MPKGENVSSFYSSNDKPRTSPSKKNEGRKDDQHYVQQGGGHRSHQMMAGGESHPAISRTRHDNIQQAPTGSPKLTGKSRKSDPDNSRNSTENSAPDGSLNSRRKPDPDGSPNSPRKSDPDDPRNSRRILDPNDPRNLPRISDPDGSPNSRRRSDPNDPRNSSRRSDQDGSPNSPRKFDSSYLSAAADKNALYEYQSLAPYAPPFGLHCDAVSGNLCFFYSALQCLFHSPGLLETLHFIGTDTTKVYKVLRSLLNKAHSFTRPDDCLSVKELVNVLRDPDVGIPHIIHQEEQPQKDSYEFLSELINVIHKETKEIEKARKTTECRKRLTKYRNLPRRPTNPERIIEDVEMELNLLDIPDMKTLVNNQHARNYLMQAADLEWSKVRERSALRSHYEVQTMNIVLCPKCRQKRLLSETMISLPVLLPMSIQKGTYDVSMQDQILKGYQKTDTFDDLTCQYCGYEPCEARRLLEEEDTNNGEPVDQDPSTGSKDIDDFLHPKKSRNELPLEYQSPSHDVKITDFGDLEKRILLGNLPPCLVVHLLRFKYSFSPYGSLNIEKNDIPVKIPIVLDLSDISVMVASSHSSIRYKLYGVIMHTGGVSSGHYSSYIRYEHHVGHSLADPERPGWYRVEGSIVEKIADIEHQLGYTRTKQSAYLLFYQRLNTD